MTTNGTATVRVTNVQTTSVTVAPTPDTVYTTAPFATGNTFTGGVYAAAAISASLRIESRASFRRGDASIRLRLPYIEPLNRLQIELMKRHRAGEDDPRIAEGILLSINAIATALRNSG